MAAHSPGLLVASDTIYSAAAALIDRGIEREAVARGALLAALQVAAPVLDASMQAQWLRDMASMLEADES